jgi:hypothetical protein
VVIKLAVVVTACLALGATAASAAPEESTVPTVRTEPALVQHVAELAALEAPLPLPTDRAPRIVLAGDSVADSFASGLAAEAARRGIGMSRSVRSGCGILPGLPTTRDGYTPPWTTACEGAAPAWRSQIAAMPADLVFFLSTWDGSTRLVDGEFVDPATPTGHATIAGLMREVVDVIAPPGSGRGVVLLAEAIPTTGEVTGVPDLTRIAEARVHLAVLRTVARSDPSRIRVVDLGQWLCPLGPPCPEVVEGVLARPNDGGHFSPDGAAWVAPRLLDALGLAPR